jgi:hypothetical protein
MATKPPICLEVKCVDVRRCSPNLFLVELTSDGGQEYAYYDSSGIYNVNLYTCFDIQPNMYFSNREGYFWKITGIHTPSAFPAVFTKIKIYLLYFYIYYVK